MRKLQPPPFTQEAKDERKVKSRITQRGKILQLLREREGGWVPLYEITALAAQYNTRIKELRDAGHRIQNQTERRNGAVYSWFRLVAPQVQPALFQEEREVLVGRP